MLKTWVAALLMMAGLAGIAEERPLRIGILTDTHVLTTDKRAQQRLRRGLAVFKNNNVDAVANIGDVAEHYDPASHLCVRAIYDEVLGEKKLPEFFVYAWHDSWGAPDKKTGLEVFLKNLRITSGGDYLRILKGIPIVTVTESTRNDVLEKLLKEAVAKCPGKPVILFDHEPAYDTVWGSIAEGNRKRRPLLNRYPQVIQFSGHVHGSMRNPRQIWQGEFTAVNAGCLKPWSGTLIGAPAPGHDTADVLILEVRDKEVLVHRYCGDTNYQEEDPARVWRFPLPVDPKTAPYLREKCRAASPAPVYPEGAKLQVAMNGKPVKTVTFRYTTAKHPDGVAKYTLLLYRKNGQGTWTKFSRIERCGDYYAAKRQAVDALTVNAAMIDAGQKVRAEVTAQDFYEKSSTPLVAEFTMPERETGKVLLDTVDPMKVCRFHADLVKDKTLRPDAKGSLIGKCHAGRLELPAEVWKDVKKGTRFRVTLELANAGHAPQLRITTLHKNDYPAGNIHTAPDGESMRYVWDFRARQDGLQYQISGWPRGNLNLKVTRIRVERGAFF